MWMQLNENKTSIEFIDIFILVSLLLFLLLLTLLNFASFVFLMNEIIIIIIGVEWSKTTKKDFFGALRKHLMFCLTICNFSSLNFFSYFFVHCFLEMQFREFFWGWLWVLRYFIGICADLWGILSLRKDWDGIDMMRLNIDVQNRERAKGKVPRIFISFL